MVNKPSQRRIVPFFLIVAPRPFSHKYHLLYFRIYTFLLFMTFIYLKYTLRCEEQHTWKLIQCVEVFLNVFLRFKLRHTKLRKVRKLFQCPSTYSCLTGCSWMQETWYCFWWGRWSSQLLPAVQACIKDNSERHPVSATQYIFIGKHRLRKIL